jgi:hypothetical protein
MKVRPIYLLVLWAIVTPRSDAADSSAGVPFPGLESDPAETVLPQASDVTVIGDKAVVLLSVRSNAQDPALLINGPQFGWMGESEPYRERHFPELEIQLDGNPVTPDERFEAFAGNINITNLIRTEQMDPWAITRTPPLTSPQVNNARVLKMLRNVDAIESVDDQDGNKFTARWTVRRLVRLPLKTAVQDQRVTLSYTLRPAFSLARIDQLVTASRQADYCVSSKNINAMLHSGPATRLVTVTEYVIPTGIDGHPPAAVTLTTARTAAKSGTPQGSLFTCGLRDTPITVTDNLVRRPVQVDKNGNLHLLRIAVPAKSPAADPADGGPPSQ